MQYWYPNEKMLAVLSQIRQILAGFEENCIGESRNLFPVCSVNCRSHLNPTSREGQKTVVLDHSAFLSSQFIVTPPPSSGLFLAALGVRGAYGHQS